MSQVLLITSVDISDGAEADFNRWYNDVHLPEVLACPGFARATRYECTNGQPRYLAIYEIDGEDALTTPEMQRVRGWGDQFPNVRNFHERIYREVHPAEAPS
jgi:hypothetical protein